MDIMFQHNVKMWWVDVAVTHAASSCLRTCRSRAQADGVAARDEERRERSRYHNRAYPFVLESLGRPGQCAKNFIRHFCVDGGEGASTSADSAWRALSTVLQSGNAQAELTAYGAGAFDSGKCFLFIP